MPKPPFDLQREVDMALTQGCTRDDAFEVIDGRWFGPPGKASYYAHGAGEQAAGLMFACPGCGELNSIAFMPFDGHPTWSWNGDRERPTASPSILSDPAKGGCGWHGFLVRGRFQLNPS